uniref:Uncharacterized protein n=1 Tax=Oryza glumipatula TaxID=40148 RepID=A0A0D9YM58_9ORYZ
MGHAAAADPAASASRPHQEAAAGEQGKQGAGEQEIVSVEELAELDSGDHNRSLAAMPVPTASSPPLPTSRRSKDVELHHPSSRIAARPPPNSSPCCAAALSPRAAARPPPTSSPLCCAATPSLACCRRPSARRLPPPLHCAAPPPPSCAPSPLQVRMKAEKENEKEDFPVMAMVAGLPMRMGPRGSTRRGTSPTTRRCWADLGGGTPRGGIK